MGSTMIWPVGHLAGYEWDHQDLTQIVQIILSYDPQRIRSLQFQYLLNGHLYTTDLIGCRYLSGSAFNMITFQAPHEYITKVEGISNSTATGIDKLCIHTNKTSYDIFEAKNYPSVGRKSFSYNFGGGNQFGGFHGTCSFEGVSSIGVYFKHLTALPLSSIKVETCGSTDGSRSSCS